MKLNFPKNLNKIVNASSVFLAIMLLIFLFWKNYSPLGRQEIIYDFTHKIPFTQGIEPATRTQKIHCDEKNSCFQELFDDPTYLNLILPRHFQNLTVEMTYEKKTFSPKLGIKIGPNWQYKIQEGQIIAEDDNWQTKTISFALHQVPVQQRLIYLIISVPAVKNSADNIKMKKFKFILTRETLLNKWKNYLLK